MDEITDLTIYRNKAYLELCLTLVEEAYQECGKENYGAAKALLGDILDTFETGNANLDSNILSFPS